LYKIISIVYYLLTQQVACLPTVAIAAAS